MWPACASYKNQVVLCVERAYYTGDEICVHLYTNPHVCVKTEVHLIV